MQNLINTTNLLFSAIHTERNPIHFAMQSYQNYHASQSKSRRPHYREGNIFIIIVIALTTLGIYKSGNEIEFIRNRLLSNVKSNAIKSQFVERTISIFLSGVHNRRPNGPEMKHFENTLFFRLNKEMESWNIPVVDISIQPSQITLMSMEEEEHFTIMSTPNWKPRDDEVRKRSLKVREGTMKGKLESSRQLSRKKFGQIESDLGYLELTLRLLTNDVQAHTPDVSSTIVYVINKASAYIINDLKTAPNLLDSEKSATKYYENLSAMVCSTEVVLEERIENQTIQPSDSEDSSDVRKFDDIREFVMGRLDNEEDIRGPDDKENLKEIKPPQITQTKKPLRKSKSQSSAHRYRTISACIFVAAFSVIVLWNMARINRKQVECRRRRVELAKLAYVVTEKDYEGTVLTTKYEGSVLDENRFVGTMDKMAENSCREQNI